MTATVEVRFDDGPVVDITVELDSSGTGFRVDADFRTSIRADTAMAAMPFEEDPIVDSPTKPCESRPAHHRK